MTKLKRFSSFLPIEFYVVFFPSVLTSCFLLLYLSQDSLKVATDYHLLTVLKTMFLNGQILENTFSYVLLYIAFRYLFAALPIGKNRTKTTRELFAHMYGKGVMANTLRGAFWFVFIALFLSTTMLIVGMISHFTAVTDIARASSELMQFDVRLFGFSPPYAIQVVGFYWMFALLIIGAYIYTPFFLGCIGFCLLFTDPTLFRKFLLMLALSMIICFPIWIAFPAVTPNEMYRHNMFNESWSPALGDTVHNTQFAPFVEDKINYIEKIWIDPNPDASKRSIAVTTMPSMHVIWGMQVALFAYYISKRLRYLAVGYFILNTLGTLLLLQHYAIDLFVGFVVGAVAFSLSVLLIREEKKYFVDRLGLVSALGVFRRDYLALRHMFTSKIHT